MKPRHPVLGFLISFSLSASLIAQPSSESPLMEPAISQSVGVAQTIQETSASAVEKKSAMPVMPAEATGIQQNAFSSAAAFQPVLQAEQVSAAAVSPPAVPLISPECNTWIQRNQLELDKLQVYVAEVNQRLEKLRKELHVGDQKRRQQAVLIDFFEQELQSLRKRHPEQDELTQTLFAELASQLPESPVFRVKSDRLVLMTDFILIFGRGEVSTEGKTRLQLITNALLKASEMIPAEVNWRWRVEGHSDSQPLRSITWFPSNWELSAARAAGVARYLIGQGIPAQRVRVAALGSSKPVEPNAETKDAHWRNRRVEIHLVFEKE
jgi:chemotaxis protein MotB